MQAAPDNGGSFLGTGWAFPPSFDRGSATTTMVSDEDDIRESIAILLKTSVGERVMQPLYGCNLLDYQFEAMNNTFLGFLTDMVKRALILFEPRIALENIDITELEDPLTLEGKLQISIDYRIERTNIRRNFVFPFYLREADSPSNPI
jgi:phage baseplate assembly protein W